jgi:hypothetical protein
MNKNPDNVSNTSIENYVNEQMIFCRAVSIGEMFDLVSCLHVVIEDVENEIAAAKEHLTVCKKVKCRRETKKDLGFLRERRKQLCLRRSALSPLLSKQKENMEFLIARNAEKRNKNDS